MIYLFYSNSALVAFTKNMTRTAYRIMIYERAFAVEMILIWKMIPLSQNEASASMNIFCPTYSESALSQKQAAAIIGSTQKLLFVRRHNDRSCTNAEERIQMGASPGIEGDSPLGEEAAGQCVPRWAESHHII